MKPSTTEEQFERALSILTAYFKKKWQHSTYLIISQTIGKAKDKDEAMDKMEKILSEAETEEAVLKEIEKQFGITSTTTEA